MLGVTPRAHRVTGTGPGHETQRNATQRNAVLKLKLKLKQTSTTISSSRNSSSKNPRHTDRSTRTELKSTYSSGTVLLTTCSSSFPRRPFVFTPQFVGQPSAPVDHHHLLGTITAGKRERERE